MWGFFIGRMNDMTILDYSTQFMTNVDLIIEARWLATVNSSTLLEHYSVVVQGDAIVDLLPTVQAKKQYKATTSVMLDEHILIPGLINLHTHSAMSLMRGIADDLPLMTWLNDHIWPAERAVVSELFV